MRRQHGAIEAIERLLQSGDIQSGFKRLQQLALLDWTIEAAVIKLRASSAKWRLVQVTRRGGLNQEH
jgi:hypothetical protein